MLTFSDALRAAGLDLASVRLLRHQDTRYPGYPSPYVLWRDNRPAFERYQQTQSFQNAPKLRAPYWAVFVGLPDKSTLFVGLYAAQLKGPLAHDLVDPMDGSVERAGSKDDYGLELCPELQEYVGRLLIEWGLGYRSWIQRGDGQPKAITELRTAFREEEFPGFDSLLFNLSQLDTLPRGWTAALGSTRGVYLLTCPRTREQYVGSATGGGGFMQRWREYAITGHGGNVALKSRAPSDYQVSILQTVGSDADERTILALEARWKNKLQSREMGLNRN